MIDSAKAQILFSEECFVGGVQAGGHSTVGTLESGSFDIHWEENYTIRRAYALCYRYGRPEPHTFFLNGSGITWNNGSQAGPELIEVNGASNFFASHVIEITDIVEINDDIVNIELPSQPFNGNRGWWGAYIVLLYESPDITTEVCTRIYVADQSQDFPQNYSIEKPAFHENNPLLFSIYSNRLASFYEDGTEITLNGNHIGDIWTSDLVTPVASTGVQGHFYYQNGMAEGLNGDTANTRVHQHDGIAIVNDYLNSESIQELGLTPISTPNIVANPHPAFTITYTPECPVKDVSIERKYRYCRGGEMQLNAEAGYAHYAWTPAEGLSDPNIANPICNRDSSGWYQVRMWDDDGCSQTIPLHVEVTDYPIPENVEIASTICPPNTGEINLLDVPGAEPITYSANELENATGQFTDLSSGSYQLHVETSDGCTWDSLVHVPLNPIQDAAFTPSPESGFTPLEVFFENESSLSATHFTWLVNGIPFSNQEDVKRVFEDAGVYEIDLVAHRQEDWCADTASFTLFVDQGMELILPNIITPNSDGRNDKLVAQVSGVADISWNITNRWGREVHAGSTSNEDGEILLWDPADIPTGSYVVTITAVGVSGQTRQEAFYVQVVR